MISDDEVMRVLERADPARVDDANSMLDSADYLDALRTSTVTLVDVQPRPPRRLRRRVIVTGAAAAVVAVVAAVVPAVSRDDSEPVRPAVPPTAAPSTTAAAPSTTAPAALAARVGLIGLPPEGATPSAPERGELVDSYFIAIGDYRYAGVARLYADGRLIWRQYFTDQVWSSSTGWVEQRLTAEGVELVRTRHGNPLQLLESLPASAWEDPQFRTYVPVGYAACLGLRDPNKLGAAQTSSVFLPPIEQLLAALPAPAANLLRGRLTVPSVLAGDPQYDCLALTTDDARRLDRALSDAGLEGGTDRMVRYHLEYIGQDGIPLEMSIGLEPVFPDGTISCSACG
jgi:hypothetical protein